MFNAKGERFKSDLGSNLLIHVGIWNRLPEKGVKHYNNSIEDIWVGTWMGEVYRIMGQIGLA